MRMIFLLVVALVGACRRGGSDPRAVTTARPIQGPPCYELQLGSWTPLKEPIHVPPRVIRLDSGQLWIPGLAGRPAPDIPSINAARARGGGRDVFQWWRRVEPDSLEILWSSGYEGTRLLLQVRGDSVSGRAVAFVHHGWKPPFPTAPVSGWRVPCPRLDGVFP